MAGNNKAEGNGRQIYVDTGHREFSSAEDALAAAIVADEFALDEEIANPAVAAQVRDRTLLKAACLEPSGRK
jgi:hypothetical protein